jgi:hypothetical protein
MSIESVFLLEGLILGMSCKIDRTFSTSGMFYNLFDSFCNASSYFAIFVQFSQWGDSLSYFVIILFSKFFLDISNFFFPIRILIVLIY